jgi:cobalt-zinc-cadmium efflux system outer membrane protein
MKMSFVSCSLSVVLCSRIIAADFAATNAVVVSPQLIESLAEEARTNYPALRAADARADAATWNAAAVRSWEDPMAKFGVMGADREKRADDGDLVYGVEQKLPLFGKPRAARELAQAEALTQRHDAAYRAHQLQRDLHKQLLKVALTERALELSQTDVAALDTIVATTEEKYRNGLATQVEVLQTQNERARRLNLLRTEENFLRAERTSLNRLVNRSVDSAWPKLFLPQAIPALPSAEEMVRHATQTAPQLDVMRASVRQAESAVRVAQRQRLPDVSIGVEGRQYADSGEFREGTVMFGLSIPWGNRSRYSADIKREQRKLEAAQLDVADMQLSLRDEITRLTIQIENARRESTLYRSDIIPRTQQATESARINWLNNRGTLRDVLEARRMLVEAQTMEARAIAEQHSMLADLILHCGLSELHDISRAAAQPAGTDTKKGTP